MRRSEVSDLKLLLGPFLLFAIPVRILSLGKGVTFPLTIDETAMLLRHRPGVYWAVVLNIEGGDRWSDLGANALLGR